MPQSLVIVGGGIIGSSTAYFASKLAHERGIDLSIKLVEGSSIAAGASGKAGGLLAIDWHGPSTASLASLSYTLHAQLAHELDGSKRWGYRTLDTLSISADLSSSTAKSTRTRKLAHEDLFPWLNKDVLTSSSVLGSKDSTAQVHPEHFTTAMVEEAQKRGVEVVYGTADGLKKRNDGGYKLSVTPRDGAAAADKLELEADQIVVAAGPWTGRLLAQLGIQSGAGRAKGIRGSRAHSVVLKTAEGRDLPAQALFTSIKEKRGHAEPEIYNRPDGTAYACGPTDDSDLPTHASSVAIDRAAISKLLQQTAQLSPDYLSTENGKHSAQVLKEQACYLPVGSGDPVLGMIEGREGKGIYVASGHSCWGICNGPGSGLVMAELLLDGKASSADISDLAP
ncbi:hypothetical protein JCM5296_006831 [Sporobolomyces johnsonii]